MPLHLRYVDEIHARLAVRYGTAWSAKWQGLDQDAIRADWAEVLDGMQPASIRKALESLPPEFPPTATAFRALGAIPEEHKPAPKLPPPDPVGLKRIAGAMGGATTRLETPAEWMARLQREVETRAASKARAAHFRTAVGNGHYSGATVEQIGDFRPIPRDRWPESMRAPEPAQPLPSQRPA